MPINDLIHKRGNILEEARKLLELVTTEKRSMTEEENSKFDAMHKDADGLKVTIDQEVRQRDADALYATDKRYMVPLKDANAPFGADSADPKERAAAHQEAFWRWVRQGHEGMTQEQRSILAAETRGPILTTTGAPGGGYWIPTLLAGQVWETAKWYGGMLQAPATDINSGGGEPMNLPTATDVSNSGSLLAEGSAATTQTNPTFSNVALNVYTYSSDIVAVSVQMLQDSAFDIQAFLTKALGVRLGRILNNHYTLGSGTGQPQGVVTAAVVFTSSVTNGFNYTDAVGLYHSLDVAYRGPNARFMLNDAVVGYARKIWDTYTGPIWQAGFMAGDPDRILGVPYIVNNDMTSTITTGKLLMLYGDFSYYARRAVQGVQLVRFGERYMDMLQVGFLAYVRAGGVVASAETGSQAPFRMLKAL